MIKLRNLDPSLQALLTQSGLVGQAEAYYITNSTGAVKGYWEPRAIDGHHWHSTIAAGLAAAISMRNDVLLLSPEGHSSATTVTWNKNMTHLIGMYPPAMMNLRSRMSSSANISPLLHVSGYGNLFANLYLMYGKDSDATLTALKITGNRNTFSHVHVAGPMHTTCADEAGFALVNIEEASAGAGNEHYFQNCVFGIETIAWTNGVMFKHKGTPRLVFEDCMFLMRTDNAQVQVLDGTVADGQGFYLFKNCVGVNLGTALTLAFGSTGLAAGTDFILHNTGFSGVTDLIAQADEAKLKITMPGATATATLAGMAQDYDHT